MNPIVITEGLFFLDTEEEAERLSVYRDILPYKIDAWRVKSSEGVWMWFQSGALSEFDEVNDFNSNNLRPVTPEAFKRAWEMWPHLYDIATIEEFKEGLRESDADVHVRVVFSDGDRNI